MKYILVVFFLLSVEIIRANEPVLADIRLAFEFACYNETKASELLSLLEKNVSTDAILLGYKGAAQSLIAKHSGNPFTKLKYTKLAMNTLQQAVRVSPVNVEIRYLRFVIQSQLPAFLRMSGNIEEDKRIILENIDSIKDNAVMKKKIAGFMINSQKCSAQEVVLLNKKFS